MDHLLSIHSMFLQLSAILSAGSAAVSIRSKFSWCGPLLLAGSSFWAGIPLFTRTCLYLPFAIMHMGGLQTAVLAGLLPASFLIMGKRPLNYQIFFISLCVCILELEAIFFPTDYYLPNIMTASSWAHIFSWGYAAARAFFMAAAALAAARLCCPDNNNKGTDIPTALGLASMCISMAAGLLWSVKCLGVALDFHQDETIGFMLIWFYWLFTCHYGLASRSDRGYQAIASGGGIVVLMVTALSSMGIWRPF